MRLLYKLLIVVALPASLIWQVGYYATNRSEDSLRRAVKSQSDFQASSLMDEIDRVIQSHLANWQGYGSSALVQDTLRESNEQLDAMEDAAAFIKRQDDIWQGNVPGVSSELAIELQANLLSKELSSILKTLHSVSESVVYGEVFIANAHGVNAAQSRRTTDYDQNGETWFEYALDHGTFVSDVLYDESSDISAVELCVRIDDQTVDTPRALGVLKAVLNIKEIFDLVNNRAMAMGSEFEQRVLLYDPRESKIIHQSNVEDSGAEMSSRYSEADVERIKTWDDRNDDELVVRVGNRDHVVAVANSELVPPINLGVLVERDRAKAMTEVHTLRREIMLIALGATLAALIFSGAVALSLSRRIRQLSDATIAVSKGDLDTSLEIYGSDELADLGHSFNEMTADIRGYAQSLESTNRQLEVARDAAEAANQAKTDFLANMSHEIRTPMNAVIGMTELVLETKLTEQQREYLTIVLESGESLLTIINEILDFSKIEAGKIELDVAPFDVHDLIGDILRSLAYRAHSKNLELASEIDPSVPEIIVADSARLRQILINLVGNAIKFTERGEILVKAKLEPRSDSEATLHISVIDTGIGIQADKQREIFDAFSQADASTTRRFGGTGLGLAISSRLVKLMHGQLTVESEVGKGSTFSFRVDVGIGQVAKKAVTAEQFRGVRVLLVDDNDTNRQILDKTLEAWGMTCAMSESAAHGLQYLKEQGDQGRPIELVITDVNMPEIDGVEFCQKIRKFDKSLPILALTSGDRPGEAKKLRNLNVARLLKPVKRSELMTALAELLCRETPAPSEKKPAPEPSPELPPSHILLAEDGLANQKLAVGLLKKWGHQVTVANNGREAVEALERESFDLVLMDVQMPEMDGLTATRAIRAAEQDTGRHVPIIALTARAMKGDREKCLSAGMDGYVSKPIHKNELNLAMAKAMSLLNDDAPG